MTNARGAGLEVMRVPPPAAEPSDKRILVAFLLCFTVCAHRIYAGRYISGIIQMAWVGGASVWAYFSFQGLLKIVNSGSLEMMDMIQTVSDWEVAHGRAVTFPAFALIAVGLWVAADAGRLLSGNFKDGRGNKITRWV